MMSVGRLAACTLMLISTFGAARTAAQAAADAPAAPAPPAAQASAPSASPAPASATEGAPAAASPATPPSAADGAAPASPYSLAPAQPTAAPPEGPPEQNPYPNASQHRWSDADVQRVRAMLAAQREQDRVEAAKPKPVKHGDAGAAFALGLSIDAIFHSDQGFHLFDSPTADARLGFWLGYDLLTVSKGWVMSADLGFGVESLEGNSLFGGDVRARLVSQTFQGGVSVRWTGCSFLAPQLRASGGVSLFDLQLDVDSEPRSHDHDVSGFGALGAGFLLHTPARTFESRSGKFASLTFGLQFEVGYAVRSSVDFALQSPSNAHNIPIVNANLGRLDLSGAYIRSSLVSRF
jgi:hypothetical protein